MNINEYQKTALGFRLPSANHFYAIINLAGEVGELSSLYAKEIRDGHKDEEALAAFNTNVKKELGDILWHVAALAYDHGLPLEEIAQTNLSKLAARKSNNTLKGSGDNR